ncbi:MAG: response regulator [Bryobacteraceae bacterium]
MVVEDNPGDLVREALKEHRVNCALPILTDGTEVIALLKQFDATVKAPPIDLLILDMHLSKRNGEEILECLRSTERRARTPVVVMISANSNVLEEKAAKHAALSYFRKSSRLDEVLEHGLIVSQLLVGAERELSPAGQLENVRRAL